MSLARIIDEMSNKIGMHNTLTIYNDFAARVYEKGRNSRYKNSDKYEKVFRRYARMYLHKKPYLNNINDRW